MTRPWKDTLIGALAWAAITFAVIWPLAGCSMRPKAIEFGSPEASPANLDPYEYSGHPQKILSEYNLPSAAGDLRMTWSFCWPWDPPQIHGCDIE